MFFRNTKLPDGKNHMNGKTLNDAVVSSPLDIDSKAQTIAYAHPFRSNVHRCFLICVKLNLHAKRNKQQ